MAVLLTAVPTLRILTALLARLISWLLVPAHSLVALRLVLAAGILLLVVLIPVRLILISHRYLLGRYSAEKYSASGVPQLLAPRNGDHTAIPYEATKEFKQMVNLWATT